MSATATLGLDSLHQEPRVGGTLGVLRDGSDGWRSPVPRGDNTGEWVFSTSPVNHPVSVRLRACDAVWCGQCTRWQVLYVRTGSLSCLQYATLRRPCGQLLRQRQIL